MNTPIRILRPVLAVLAFSAGAVTTYALLNRLLALYANPRPGAAESVFAEVLPALLVIGGGIAAAWGALRALPRVGSARDTGAPRRRLRRLAVAAVLCAYAVTWGVGGPMATNDLTREVLEIRGDERTERMRPPWIGVRLVVPLLPCVLLTRHDFHSGTAGGGAWSLYVWYGADVERIWSRPWWII